VLACALRDAGFQCTFHRITCKIVCPVGESNCEQSLSFAESKFRKCCRSALFMQLLSIDQARLR